LCCACSIGRIALASRNFQIDMGAWPIPIPITSRQPGADFSKKRKGKALRTAGKKESKQLFQQAFSTADILLRCVWMFVNNSFPRQFLLSAAHPSGRAIAEEIRAKLTPQVKLDDSLRETQRNLPTLCWSNRCRPKKRYRGSSRICRKTAWVATKPPRLCQPGQETGSLQIVGGSVSRA
jgi:hypothetical protein